MISKPAGLKEFIETVSRVPPAKLNELVVLGKEVLAEQERRKQGAQP